jgi:glucoamylase
VTFDIGNGGGGVDPRTVVDAGFLELVRLGIMSPSDPTIVNSLRVVDRRIAKSINKHTYFYRYTKDGYGEAADGSPWSTGGGTRGRLWPLLSGERGEYALLAGHSGAPQLAAMAAATTSTYLIPEQVWDSSAPAGTGGRAPGSPSASATPLGWSHAQFIRLAWGISNGSPVEYPRVVACHFLHRCAKSVVKET